jgi:hypothetical protein
MLPFSLVKKRDIWLLIYAKIKREHKQLLCRAPCYIFAKKEFLLTILIYLSLAGDLYKLVEQIPPYHILVHYYKHL